MLLNDEYESDEDIPTVKNVKGDNHILHMNLSLIAIILQGSILHAAIRPFQIDGRPMDMVELLVKVIPLLITSVWMAYNLKYEKDPIQYQKNTRIEFVYCSIQASIYLTGM